MTSTSSLPSNPSSARSVFASDALAGQVALVTGAAAGIGLATARALAGCGAKVMLADLPDRRASAGAAPVGRRCAGRLRVGGCG